MTMTIKAFILAGLVALAIAPATVSGNPVHCVNDHGEVDCQTQDLPRCHARANYKNDQTYWARASCLVSPQWNSHCTIYVDHQSSPTFYCGPW